MDYLTSFKICSSGLAAQRAKMDVLTSNIANVETTRTPEGGPYKRKTVVLASEQANPFDDNMKEAVRMVKVEAVVENKEVKMMFNPSHPDADAKGFVAMPDINLVMEMAEMINTSRNYEACVTAFDATKNMTMKSLEIGK